ncbi:MAG: hypothetical protein J6C86_11250 [Bacteroidaceae bacterium]|nr:hypothetical protein [Bacteroidaceae bacterium]
MAKIPIFSLEKRQIHDYLPWKSGIFSNKNLGKAAKSRFFSMEKWQKHTTFAIEKRQYKLIASENQAIRENYAEEED